jgi:hypothetical protein
MSSTPRAVRALQSLRLALPSRAGGGPRDSDRPADGDWADPPDSGWGAAPAFAYYCGGRCGPHRRTHSSKLTALQPHGSTGGTPDLPRRLAAIIIRCRTAVVQHGGVTARSAAVVRSRSRSRSLARGRRADGRVMAMASATVELLNASPLAAAGKSGEVKASLAGLLLFNTSSASRRWEFALDARVVTIYSRCVCGPSGPEPYGWFKIRQPQFYSKFTRPKRFNRNTGDKRISN